jgi:hypothetical protein
MSRSLERTSPLFVPGGTSLLLLTCPTGHKYEVIDSWASGDTVAGRIVPILLTTAAAATAFIDDWPTAAGFQVQHQTYNAVVMYPGDTLTGFALGAGFAGSAFMLSYVDVDYT